MENFKSVDAKQEFIDNYKEQVLSILLSMDRANDWLDILEEEVTIGFNIEIEADENDLLLEVYSSEEWLEKQKQIVAGYRRLLKKIENIGNLL